MNYLVQLIHDLHLDAVYYTPQQVIDKITYDCIIGNPPFKK